MVCIGKRGKITISCTPFDQYYLSLVWVYLDTKMCLDTFTLTIGNSGRRGRKFTLKNYKIMTSLFIATFMMPFSE
jgi:hypothetical protein